MVQVVRKMAWGKQFADSAKHWRRAIVPIAVQVHVNLEGLRRPRSNTKAE
jgi:hypothetical protein